MRPPSYILAFLLTWLGTTTMVWFGALLLRNLYVYIYTNLWNLFSIIAVFNNVMNDLPNNILFFVDTFCRFSAAVFISQLTLMTPIFWWLHIKESRFGTYCFFAMSLGALEVFCFLAMLRLQLSDHDMWAYRLDGVRIMVGGVAGLTAASVWWSVYERRWQKYQALHLADTFL